MKSLRYAFAFACLCPMAALWGCAPGSGGDDEKTGEAPAAFGESTCGTDTTGVTTLAGDVTGCGEQIGTTSGSSYGDSACVDGFKVALTGTMSSNAIAGVQWNNGLTETQCPNAWIGIDVYNSAGTLVTSGSASGSWGSAPFTNTCWVFTSVNMPAGTGFRVVAMAGLTESCSGKTCSVATEAPVELTVAYNAGDC
jgi:hypothetical protein